VAIETIHHSQGTGHNATNYIQFDSIQKFRSVYANTYDSRSQRCLDNRKLRSDKGQIMSFISSPTDSIFFYVYEWMQKMHGKIN
jgi:hypothetical protein